MHRVNVGKSLKKVFSEIDGSGDISFEEFSAKKSPHSDAKTIFNNTDYDFDEYISKEELENHKPPNKHQIIIVDTIT